MSTRKSKSPLAKSAPPAPAAAKAAPASSSVPVKSSPAVPASAKPAPATAPTAAKPATAASSVAPKPVVSSTPFAPKPAPAVAPVPKPAPVASAPVAAKPVSSPNTGRVCLELVKPGAKQVCVAGSFNQWKPEQAPLVQMGNGRWVGDLAVSPGRYEYLFVVDGQWLPDPNAKETVQNPFGGVNSVLTVSN